MARPNIMLFGDAPFVRARAQAQEARLEAWLAGVRSSGARLAVVDVGSGTAIPTVRARAQAVARAHGAPLVRINLREPRVPEGALLREDGGGGGAVELPMAALAALRAIVRV